MKISTEMTLIKRNLTTVCMAWRKWRKCVDHEVPSRIYQIFYYLLIVASKNYVIADLLLT